MTAAPVAVPEITDNAIASSAYALSYSVILRVMVFHFTIVMS